MQTRISFSLKFVAILGGILAVTTCVVAQDVAPPPGFAPGQEVESRPSAAPAPGFLQSQDATRRGDFNPGQPDYFPETHDRYQPYQAIQTDAAPPPPSCLAPT